jgi:DNA-binding HxlR family transcriptional regulator
MKERLNIIRLIAQSYVLEILGELKRPRRFKELRAVCGNKRTLSKKLDMLENIGFVETVAVKDQAGRYVNMYRITRRGKLLLVRLKQLSI